MKITRKIITLLLALVLCTSLLTIPVSASDAPIETTDIIWRFLMKSQRVTMS